MKRVIILQLEVAYEADTENLSDAIDEAKDWAATMTFTDPSDWMFVAVEKD